MFFYLMYKNLFLNIEKYSSIAFGCLPKKYYTWAITQIVHK